MKLVCFSDIHADYNFKLPKGDVLVYCGDFSGMGTLQDIAVFNTFLLDHKDDYQEILVVYGNHETASECNLAVSQALFTGCHVLTDEGITIDGVKFYGTPFTKTFYNWAFMKSEKDLVAVYDQIPKDTDVVIAHGPPYGILDQNSWGEHCGSTAFLERMKVVKPKACIFGHIHASSGVIRLNETTYINASLLDDNYAMAFKPRVLEIK